MYGDPPAWNVELVECRFGCCEGMTRYSERGRRDCTFGRRAETRDHLNILPNRIRLSTLTHSPAQLPGAIHRVRVVRTIGSFPRYLNNSIAEENRKEKGAVRGWNKSSPGSSHFGGAWLRNFISQFYLRGLLRGALLLSRPRNPVPISYIAAVRKHARFRDLCTDHTVDQY